LAYKVGTVLIDIKADTAKIVKGVDRVEKKFNEMQTHIEKTSDRIRNAILAIGTAWATVESAIKIKDLGMSFISTAAKMEQFSTALISIEGSSKKAQQSIQWIQEFAKKTPYTLDEVTEAFIKLRAYGLNAIKDLKWLGDTASAMGKPLDQAVEAIADAVNGEFERLKEFGIKAYQQGDKVALQWTTRRGEVKNIVIENNSKIIESTLKAIWNSKYAGAMQNQSKTWIGLLSTIQGNWEIFQNNIMKAGLFDYLKANLLTIGDYLNKVFGKGEKAAKKYSNTIIDMSKNVIVGVANFLDVAKDAKRAFDYFKIGINVIKLAFYSVLDLSESISVKIHNLATKIHNDLLFSLKKLPKFMQPDWVKNNKLEKYEIYTGKYLKDIQEAKENLLDAIKETKKELPNFTKLAKQYLKDVEKHYMVLNNATQNNVKTTTNYINVLELLGQVSNGSFKGFKTNVDNTNKALEKQQKLLQQIQDLYNQNLLTPKEQINAWFDEYKKKIDETITDEAQKEKALNLLKQVYNVKLYNLKKEQLQKLKDLYDKYIKENYQDTLNIINAIQDALNNDIFNFLTGKFKNLGDFVKHLFDDVGKAISQSLAKNMANSITNTLTNQLKTLLLPNQQDLKQAIMRVILTDKK